MPSYHQTFTLYKDYILQQTYKRIVHKTAMGVKSSIDEKILSVLNGISAECYQFFKEVLYAKFELGQRPMQEPEICYDNWRDLFQDYREGIEKVQLIALWCFVLINPDEILINPDEILGIEKTELQKAEKLVFACFDSVSERNRILQVLETLASAADEESVSLSNGMSLLQLTRILEDTNLTQENILDSDLLHGAIRPGYSI